MDLSIPPFDRYRIRLRLTTGTRFRFLHGGVLRGLISGALERHDLPPGIIPFAPESGRVHFAAGDRYHLGVTFVGDERRVGGRLFAGLVKLGARAQPAALPPTLGGNFEVEAIEPLPSVDLDAEIATLAAHPEVTTEFLSPLRLKRPDDLLEPGAAYLNADCFPGGHFLERLWSRLFLLTHGRYPERDERCAATIGATRIATVPTEMPWLDLPVTGARSKERSYTLGGVLGRVTWPHLPQSWLPVLAAGRHLHAGAGTAYGLGRYRLSTDPTAEPFVPARPPTPDVDIPDLPMALNANLEDSSLAFQLGLSPQGSVRGERHAYRDGFRWRQPADLSELLHLVDPRLLQDRLRALLPLQLTGGAPLLSHSLGRLPASARSTLALLVLPEIAAALRPDARLLRMADGFHLLGRSNLHLTPLVGAKAFAAARPPQEWRYERAID